MKMFDIDPASRYEYIVFRGRDVQDINIWQYANNSPSKYLGCNEAETISALQLGRFNINQYIYNGARCLLSFIVGPSVILFTIDYPVDPIVNNSITSASSSSSTLIIMGYGYSLVKASIIIRRRHLP